jgi:ABC-type transporter Mla subunit MlaD
MNQEVRGNVRSDAFLGLFAAISLLLLAAFWFWFKSESPFHPPQRFSVYFHNAAGINTNAGVVVDGVRVGTVEKIRLEGKRKVLLEFQISSPDIVIREGATFNILVNGAVGAKYVDVTLGDLPEGQPLPPPLGPNSLVWGEDPVRVEVILNKIAKELDSMHPVRDETELRRDMTKFSAAADSLTVLADKLGPVADKASIVADQVGGLASEFRLTSKHINKLLDDPEFSGDLKDITKTAKEAAESIQATMHELNGTLHNKDVRADVLSALQQLNQSAQHIQNATTNVEQITADKSLRKDLKEIIHETRDTVNRVDQMVNEPGFGNDVRNTLANSRSAIHHLDLVAQQLNQILDKKHPLVHLIFGRPGELKMKSVKVETKVGDNPPVKVETKLGTAPDSASAQ